MNLSQLYYFRKLAELQHYTRAAKELFITQPTLSGSISSLESELGVSLFQKSGRNVELTKYGAEFLTYVTASLEQLDKGIAIMKGYSGESDGGTIDMGCIITLQTDYVPLLLKGYRSSSDHDYDFSLSQAPSLNLLEGLTSSSHDVVFCAKDVHIDNVEYVPVARQQLVVVVNDDSELADKGFVCPQDLEGLDLISYRECLPVGQSIKSLLDELDIENVRYIYDDESILAGIAASGNEVAIMMDTFFLTNIHGVVCLPFYRSLEDRRPLYHTIYMAYSTKNYRPYCVDHFIDYVRDHALDRSSDDCLYLD
ncbi:MAG: LysR family transcriptional regulator [Coriobacteriia bacterium]|nr:LysR family transcriptional regulator [Coriobacteriia bacterium]